MGDRVNVQVTIYGHVTNAEALLDLVEAIATDLTGHSESEIAQEIIDFLERHPKLRGPGPTFDADVNYADVSTIVASAISGEIDIRTSWGAGFEFDAGVTTVINGLQFDAIGADQIAIPIAKLQEFLPGDIEGLRHYVDAADGKLCQPFSTTLAVLKSLEQIANNEWD